MRIPVLYLAPWVDFGGSDKGTIDWFRWIDRDRYAPSLITTQPSGNRRLAEVYPFAEEVWALPEHMAGPSFPSFIFDFIHTRGVRLLHIMNSRLAFELLPDLAARDRPPAVVVQLHVEESDRSGYVRYVCTRYGNLVDAFSVTSQHLARAVEAYDIPPSRIHVIPSGVDAEHEFNPERVAPRDGFEASGAFTVLFAGRLADQKDPFLMVEVARKLVERHPNVRVEVVGDGPLEPALRRRVQELGLTDRVGFHPPAQELARWLASSDALLMTSTFEGVPYTIYEAMAMGVPVVAPALPGNLELVEDGGTGFLIEPRIDRDAYVTALGRLIEDPRLREELGSAARARALERFSLRDMAADHETLYETLLSRRASRADGPASPAARSGRVSASSSARIELCQRPPRGYPLVSVVTPCFNHGHYLPSLITSVEQQDYPAIEVIVVDDASTDRQTLDELERLESSGRAKIIREERNGGPSRTRNRGIAEAAGRYLLPVDADNMLLPGAISRLVEQLRDAGEQVGFVYPSFQYFGTRDSRFDAPAYNLFTLLHGNFADTCSLLDRMIFDAGVRYPEDMEIGHEDWDLALELAGRGVFGEPSRGPVMLYRKQGFTRSDLVEYRQPPFVVEIQMRHPELFGSPHDVGSWGRYKDPTLAVKRRWSPALSVVCTAPVEFETAPGRSLLAGLRGQSCPDLELIAECPRRPAHSEVNVRRIPPGLAGTDMDRVQEALDLSRGRFVLMSLCAEVLMRDRTVVEKLMRGFMIDPDLDAVVLADVGVEGRFPMRTLPEIGPGARAHTVVWRTSANERLGALPLRDGDLLDSAVEAMEDAGLSLQWRHYPAGARIDPPALPCGDFRTVSVHAVNGAQPPATSKEREQRLGVCPAIPAMRPGQVRRWTWSAAWMPPETRPLVRHVNVDGTRRIVTNDHAPPPGFKIEFEIGSIQRFSPPGTVRLVHRDGRFLTHPRGSERPEEDEELGHLEQSPLPLFVGAERALLDDGSETIVLASERDPVRARARELTFLGFLEGYPNEPIAIPPHTHAWQRSHVILLRVLDRPARRHRYLVAPKPLGLDPGVELSAELGLLRTGPPRDGVALWIDRHGRVSSDIHVPAPRAPDPRQLVRWALAPLAWRHFGHVKGRARSVVRRSTDAGRVALMGLLAPEASTPEAGRQLLGYLHADSANTRVPLVAATHPVLGDQFLTHHPIEATDLGYVDVAILGYVEASAPLTGQLGGRRSAIPWASRFGLGARTG
jgi:glycosyltransferase involved in cell wall biosynthesis